jgi:type IV secretory pathway VirB10-like protein
MSKKDDQQLKIRAYATRSPELNKTLFLVLFGAVILLIGFAIVVSFHVPLKSKNQVTKTAVEIKATSPLPISDLIKDLPVSYQEAEKIKQYQITKNDILPQKVQDELNYLKAQQIELQQKLMLLTVKSNYNVDDRSAAQVQQAKNSLLFFSSVPPQSEEREFNKPSITMGNVQKNKDGSDSTGYDQQNMQEQKIKFLEPSAESEDIYDLHNITKPISPYEVQAGTLVPAVLITGINTSLPGDVVAQVRQDVYDTVSGRYLLIPKGSRLLGNYDSRVSYGQRRVLIAFIRIIRPDGSSILLTKSGGADLQGGAGMEGNVDNHWLKILGAATLSTVLSIGAGVASDNSYQAHSDYPSAKQGAILGAATSINQTGQTLVERNINIQPTLSIPPGFRFNIIVQKDMVLTPYKVETGLSALRG